MGHESCHQIFERGRDIVLFCYREQRVWRWSSTAAREKKSQAKLPVVMKTRQWSKLPKEAVEIPVLRGLLVEARLGSVWDGVGTANPAAGQRARMR